MAHSDGRLAGVIALAVSIGVGVPPVASQALGQFSKTFAAITVGQDRLDRVRALYGPGAQAELAEVKSLCYWVEQDQSYLSVSTFARESRIRSVSLTTFANATPGCQGAKIKSKHLEAFPGVSLGDPIAAVVGVLGQPLGTGTQRVGEHDLTYADYFIAGGRATCQFEHDRLVLISIELD